MSATPQTNPDNQEIDLSQISKKIGSFFENISTQIFKGILFFKRNIVWLGILVVIGGGLGYLLDRGKVYESQMIVMPNFGSTDYLYAKVNLINSKIEEGDTIFLKKVVGLKEPKKIKGIMVTPIADVYKFIENKNQNFELIKLMAEDGDIKKIVNESLTSKNYPFHLVTFSTVGLTTNEGTIDPILNYLNDTNFYKLVQKEYLNNIRIKMVENDTIISQINGFLNSLNNTVNGQQKSDKLVYYNENSQLDEVLKTKDELIKEQGNHRIELVNYDKVIKDNSVTLNIKDNSSINGKMKIVLPIVFILLFVLVGLLKAYYKHQMAKLNQ